MRLLLLLLLAMAGGGAPLHAQMNDAQCVRSPGLAGCQNRGMAPAVPLSATVDMAIGGKTYSVPFGALLGRPNGAAKLDESGGLFVDGGVAPAAVYTAMFPGTTFLDRVSASFDSAPGDAVLGQRTGVASYYRNRAAAVGINGGAVGMFASGTCEAPGSACWGWNSLLQDAATRAVGTTVGKFLIGAEFDSNVMNPGTNVIGVSVGGNSLAQPTNANGFIVNSLGNGNRWTGGFITIDGAAQFGLLIGASLATGVNVPSQYAAFGYRDSAGTKQTATLQVVSANNGSTGFLSLTSTGGVDVTLNGRTLYAGGVNVGNSTFTGSIYFSALPTCAPALPASSVCRDNTTTPATLKVM